jgi:hypothetical protein
MSRASDALRYLSGIVMVAWVWVSAASTPLPPWAEVWVILSIVGRVAICCGITAAIYREHLR